MILSRNPLLKPASSRSVLAQMPFAHVGSLIIRVLHQLRKNVKPAVEWHAVPRAPVNVRPCDRHERRPRRCANRVSDISPLESHGFRSELVQVGRVNLDTSVTSERIRSLLILQLMGALLAATANAAPNFDVAAKATNELAVDLHRQLATGDENLCVSPYSIETALAMTFAGADGETRTEMARVLHLTDDRAVPSSFALLQNSLEQMSAKTAEQVKQSKKSGSPSEPITLNFANRLFAQKGYAFRPAFLMHLTHNYGAAFEPLDFIADPGGATQQINKWV